MYTRKVWFDLIYYGAFQLVGLVSDSLPPRSLLCEGRLRFYISIHEGYIYIHENEGNAVLFVLSVAWGMYGYSVFFFRIPDGTRFVLLTLRRCIAFSISFRTPDGIILVVVETGLFLIGQTGLLLIGRSGGGGVSYFCQPGILVEGDGLSRMSKYLWMGRASEIRARRGNQE